MAHGRLPPGVAGRAPRRGRLRAGACRCLMPKFSIRKVFQWFTQSARVSRFRWIALISVRAPGGYPPAPYAFLSRAKIGAMQVMLGSLERFPSRRAQAWPSGLSSAVYKDPEQCACGRRANHSIVGLQRLRPSRGAANRRERLPGCPFNSLLRRTNVLERAPLQQRSNKYGFAGRLASMLYRQRCELAGQLSAI